MPSGPVRRFACVRTAMSYNELHQDVPATSTWFMTPRPGMDVSRRDCFELLELSVDGRDDVGCGPADAQHVHRKLGERKRATPSGRLRVVHADQSLAGALLQLAGNGQGVGVSTEVRPVMRVISSAEGRSLCQRGRVDEDVTPAKRGCFEPAQQACAVPRQSAPLRRWGESGRAGAGRLAPDWRRARWP